MFWLEWLRHKISFQPRQGRRDARSSRQGAPLRLETLEDRCTPSVVGTVDLSGAKLLATDRSQLGQAISVQAQVRNAGTAASGPFQVQWYLSRDSAGSSDDILLSRGNGATSYAHASIGANSTAALFSVSLVLPGSLPGGWDGVSFYVIQKTDATNAVAETNENNNFGQVGTNLDRDPILVAGNKITGHIVADLPGDEHLPAIDVFLQRVSAGPNGVPQTGLNIQFGIQTWVVVHGRLDSSASFQSLAAAIDGYKAGDQVLVLDWSQGAADNHEGWIPDEVALDGAAWIPHVGEWTKTTLVSLGVTSDKLDLVGHSWGTYVAYEIANRVPGTNEVIVALDPAAAAVDYDYTAVNFAAVSRRAWAFYGDGLFGSADLAKTADEAFLLEYDSGSWFGVDPFTAHAAPVRLFESLVLRNNQGAAPTRASLFNLSRLETPVTRPWMVNGYDGGFEGVFTVKDVNNNGSYGDAWTEVTAFHYKNAKGQEVVV